MESIVKKRSIVFAFVVLFAIALTNCKEGDGQADYGFGVIYIPQATFTGLDNTFPVPGGGGPNTYNYKVDNSGGKLNIILGVLRAGKIADAGGFTVDVLVSTGETNEAIASGEIRNAEALPSSMYTMDNKVTVEAGKNSASFYLSVDINQLLDGANEGKNLVLAVAIANPTDFELSETNTSVVVIIDVEAMRSIIRP